MTEQAAPPQAAPPERRLVFHEKATTEANNFAVFLLDAIPELESIAIVFNFAVQGQDLPAAVIRGLSGQLKSPVEIMHMCAQLGRVWNAQIQAGHQCVHTLDQYMADQAKKLQELQQKITDLEGQLDATKRDQPPA